MSELGGDRHGEGEEITARRRRERGELQFPQHPDAGGEVQEVLKQDPALERAVRPETGDSEECVEGKVSCVAVRIGEGERCRVEEGCIPERGFFAHQPEVAVFEDIAVEEGVECAGQCGKVPPEVRHQLEKNSGQEEWNAPQQSGAPR